MNEAKWQTQIQVKSRSARIIFPGQPGREGGEGCRRNEMDKTQQNKTERTGCCEGVVPILMSWTRQNKTRQDGAYRDVERVVVQLLTRQTRRSIPGSWEGVVPTMMRWTRQDIKTKQNKTERTEVSRGGGADVNETDKTRQDKTERAELGVEVYWCRCWWDEQDETKQDRTEYRGVAGWMVKLLMRKTRQHTGMLRRDGAYVAQYVVPRLLWLPAS